MKYNSNIDDKDKDEKNNKDRKDKKDDKKGLASLKRAIKDFVYGMAAHDMVTYSLRTRMHMENLFMLIVMGDMLGIPILPPYYSLRLLPYVVPHVKIWKRTLLRDRDVTDRMFGG